MHPKPCILLYIFYILFYHYSSSSDSLSHLYFLPSALLRRQPLRELQLLQELRVLRLAEVQRQHHGPLALHRLAPRAVLPQQRYLQSDAEAVGVRLEGVELRLIICGRLFRWSFFFLVDHHKKSIKDIHVHPYSYLENSFLGSRIA